MNSSPRRRAVRRQVGHDELDVGAEQRGVARPLGTAELRAVEEDETDQCCHGRHPPPGHARAGGWMVGCAPWSPPTSSPPSCPGRRCTLLDVQYNLRGTPGPELYAAAHLPGAPHLDLDAALAGPPGARGRHPLPDPAVLEAALRAAGVGDDDEVVVYDQATSLAAGRAWWVLRWAGHPQVRVLDGGLEAWRRAGMPVTDRGAHPGSRGRHRAARIGAGARRGVGRGHGPARHPARRSRAGALPRGDRADRPGRGARARLR